MATQKSSVGSGVGGHAVTVQVLSTSQSSQNPVISNKVYLTVNCYNSNNVLTFTRMHEKFKLQEFRKFL